MKLFRTVGHFGIAAVGVFIFTSRAGAEVSPLCSDLARFACAPGAYSDGTGQVKSEKDVKAEIAAYADDAGKQLRNRIQVLLDQPESWEFRKIAMASLGLDSSPQCSSKSSAELAACRDNIVEGVTTLAEKLTLGPFAARNPIGGVTNLASASKILDRNEFRKLVVDFNTKIAADLAGKEQIQNIEKNIFPKVKELIISRLRQLPITEEQRKGMIARVEAISFNGTSCGKSRPNANKEIISSMLIPNANYNPEDNSFRLCSGYLIQSSSEFQIVTSMAHELTHSIDPCRWATKSGGLFEYNHPGDLSSMEREYPIKNVLSCLRDSRSVGAQHFTEPDSDATSFLMLKGFGMSVSKSQKNGFENTPREEDQKSFCENDQINESLCDWMAFEVLPRYVKANYKLTAEQYRYGYANARRPSCRATGDRATSADSHPATVDRINRLLLVNPEIRAQMGCPAKHPNYIYCDPKRDNAEKINSFYSPAANSGERNGQK